MPLIKNKTKWSQPKSSFCREETAFYGKDPLNHDFLGHLFISQIFNVKHCFSSLDHRCYYVFHWKEKSRKTTLRESWTFLFQSDCSMKIKPDENWKKKLIARNKQGNFPLVQKPSLFSSIISQFIINGLESTSKGYAFSSLGLKNIFHNTWKE